ncbi:MULTISPECIES: PTS sugar transporter subunit IIA [Enterococcus]|uniref:PTS sugar transporter subunit IIA n=2 Tax=Enterococcus TaxID=1350 RepID=UPI0018A11A59|nr:PTS sugar transporter subunit IIA [Enterococcus dispar]
MIGCVLTGHGSFAPGLYGALTMIAGEPDFFEVVAFADGENVDDFEARMKQAVQTLADTCEGVLVFSDLLGGSPFKTAMIAAQDFENVEVITGANLPMLIETIGLRYANTELNQLVDQAVAAGQSGVVHAQLVIHDDEDEAAEAEEGI